MMVDLVEAPPQRSPMQARLEQLGACREAVEWGGTQTLEEAWAACPRADWLAWVALRVRAVGVEAGRDLALALAWQVVGRAPEHCRPLLEVITEWRPANGVGSVRRLLAALGAIVQCARAHFRRREEQRRIALEQAALTFNVHDRATLEVVARAAGAKHGTALRRCAAALTVLYAAMRVGLAACCRGTHVVVERERWLTGKLSRDYVQLAAGAAQAVAVDPREARVLADLVRAHVPLRSVVRRLAVPS